MNATLEIHQEDITKFVQADQVDKDANDVQDEQFENYTIVSKEQIDQFLRFLSETPDAMPLVVGCDLLTTEGAILLKAGKELNDKLYEIIQDRFKKDTITSVSIRQDKALCHLFKSVVANEFNKAIQSFKKDNRLLVYVFTNIEHVIPVIISESQMECQQLLPFIEVVLGSDRELLDHLIMTALFILGVLSKHEDFMTLPKAERAEIQTHALFTGLFSDIALASVEYTPDIDQGDGHAMRSASIAEQCNLPQAVSEAIRLSHCFESKVKIPANNLLAHSLSLFEYYNQYMLKCSGGKSVKNEDEYLEQFFFDQGVLVHLQFFNKDLVDILSKSFEEFQKAQEEGFGVSEVVSKCKFPTKKGPLATPYPYERNVTQVLCRGNQSNCPYYDNKTATSGMIYFSKDVQIGNLLVRTAIESGYYGKCKLEQLLPAYRKQL